MRKINPSRDQLLKSSERRLRFMMIRTLESFERRFDDIEDSKDGKLFKNDVRNMFNDAMRAQRDELYDYEVDYRPLKVGDDSSLILSRSFLESVRAIDFSIFDGKPSMRIFASEDKHKILSAVRQEFGAGVIYKRDDKLILEIAGTQDCANCVLFIMDKYRLSDQVREKYKNWREEVVKYYRS